MYICSINPFFPFCMLCFFSLPGSSECPPGQLSCVDSVGCVNSSARCDGQIQCPTGSDEEYCPATKSCLESDWTCRNNICIPTELRCNGLNDCLDNSDEDNCGEKGGGLNIAPQECIHTSKILKMPILCSTCIILFWSFAMFYQPSP